MHLKTQKKHRNKTTNQIFQLFEVTNLMKGKEDQRGRRGGNFATLYKQPQCWVNKVFVLEKKNSCIWAIELFDFKMDALRVIIELRILKLKSEIILVISNRTHSACLFDFEIMRMI